jgi:tetratricopeptide (TPR) repeat protein
MRLVFFVILHFSSLSLKAQSLHLITPFALRDREIGKDAQSNLRSLEVQAEYISQYTGLHLKKYSLDFSKSSMVEFMNNFTCSTNDVILFYFLGHGFRYENQTSPFPTLFFNNDKDIVRNGESIEDAFNKNSIGTQIIKNTLKSKNPRLLIVFSDACNSEESISEPIYDKGVYLGSTSSIPKFITDRYKDLFMNVAGDITISSSSPGEKSINISKGSIFSQCVDISLKQHLSTYNPITWKMVVEDISDKTKQMISTQVINPQFHQQTPFYEINLTNTSTNSIAENISHPIVSTDQSTYSFFIQMGNELFNNKQYSQALLYYKKALKFNQSDYVANHSIFLTEVALGQEEFSTYDFREAYQIFNKLESHNYFRERAFVNAQYALGIMYLRGRGCKKDFKKSMHWLSLASTNGNMKATTIIEKFY